MQPLDGLLIGQPKYDDSELYRLIVARTIQTGAATCKADFDHQIRKIGFLADCDAIIARTDRHPGCRAQLDAGQFACKCGRAWARDDLDPPACIKT